LLVLPVLLLLWTKPVPPGMFIMDAASAEEDDDEEG